MDSKFMKAEYYRNREDSWVSFDERVLSEARDKTIPLFERLKFLSITASNLDEFFMIRVASLKDMVHAGYTKKDIAGLTAQEQIDLILRRIHDMVNVQYSTYNRSLLPALKANGLEVVTKHENLTKEQERFVDRYFDETIYPVLTPMAMDSSRPFPLIRNKTLNIGALISKKNKKDEATQFATVQVPSVLPRIIELPATEAGNRCVILLEEVIERNMGKLFLNYNVVCAHPYRIMRNADLTIEEDEAADLLKEIQKQLKKRQWGEVIRLEIEDGMNKQLLKILRKEFDIKGDDIFAINGPLDLTFLMKMYSMNGFDHLKEKPYTSQPVPALMDKEDIFEAIREEDILLHHPYMTFDPVVNFVRQAAKDPDVLAIKQTLYRVSGNSPIIAALAQAAENGNDSTAKLYTDCGLLTCAEAIGEDATAVFNMLSGYSEPKHWNRLSLAPIWLRDRFRELIERETQHARNGEKAHIIAKMNSLCDQEIITLLYEASAAGVQIDLIVRGICCLKTGISGISENITVRSIVGTFLEHARIFYFYNNGTEEYYMGSADWMPRNLDKRVEILFPVESEKLQKELGHILTIQLEDNMKAHVLQPDGSYEKVDRRGKQKLCAQEYFCQEAIERAKKPEDPAKDRVFIPEEAIKE